MPLASEDRSLIQKIGGQIHSAQIRTNELLIETNDLLREIRDAVKNPPERISGEEHRWPPGGPQGFGID